MFKEDACIRNLLSELPTELWDDFNRVWKESLDEKKYVLQHKYSLGLLAKKAIQLENNNPQYKKLLFKIQTLLNISSKRVLDRAYRLVNTFSKSEIKKLTEITTSGFCLCWSHFDYVLVGYLNKEQMISYLEFAKRYSISPLELYKKIKKDNRRDSTTNASKKISSSVEFLKTARDYLDVCATRDAWLSGIPDNVLQSWKKDWDSETLREISESLDNHITKCYLLKERLCK